ncbi:MAG: DUF262 domain-containing protein [Bacteroidales bacterium]|nr:DUF262 domain-containing protein [Bacteroidales bacterium]
MDNTKAISFWQFLEKYKIEIPIIQRDYAQGRKGKEELRRSFLTNLKEALDKEKELKLDFVYGAINNNTLTPLDGQQRLTTLWLLHWYVALRAGKLKETETQEKLKKFSYETRVSSREFCEQLCNCENFKSFKPENDKIVEFITNQTWFYSAWKQDPTIQSMLRMLSGTKETDKSGNDFIDGIEELFDGVKDLKDFTEYWERLSRENCPITFYHLPLENFGLSDDLYIKMNARGKQLTDFENLKADLIGYIQENKWEIQNDIAIKFDTTWTDLFWENKNNENEIDDIYFTFLNRFFWNELFIAKKDGKHILDIGKGDETSTQENENHSYKYLNEIDEKIEKNNNTERFYQGLDKYKYFDREIPLDCFEKLRKVLDNYISYKKDNKDYECSWNKEFSFIPKYKEGKILTLNQRERIVFYAIYKYFDHDTNIQYTKESFDRWMRVIWNLVSGEDNSGRSNIRSTSAMRKAIEFIEELDAHNVYWSLIGQEKIQGNSEFEERCKEEIEKARKIISDKTWEQAIKDAENLLFFKGTIRFLFRNDVGTDWDNFKTKRDKVNNYFEEGGIKEDYKVKLAKALVLQCNKEQIYDKQIFNPNASTWLWILSSKDYQKAVHNILMNDNIDKLLESLNNNSNTLDLNGTSLNLINLPYKEMIKIPKGRFRYNYKLLGYYEPYGRDAITFDNKRNEILSNLCNNGEIMTENRINNTTFFWGWDIDFTYKEKSFRWKSDNNVCLIDKDKKIEVDDKINKDNFTQKLGELLESDNSN